MDRKITILLAILLAALLFAGCAGAGETQFKPTGAAPTATLEATPDETFLGASGAALDTANIRMPRHTAKNRTFYEIYVGSFRDSDGDGIGDLRGIIENLDYLNSEDGEGCLGVQGIWLMPVFPSPTYHKYDVTDYYSIDPDYGTMEDFEMLINEAKRRGIDVIIDLPLNHTSSRHPWFLAALEEIESGGEPHYRDYYNFSEERQSGEYYPTAGGLFYEAHFWDQMPDLNMDSMELRMEIADIAKFWLEKGASGFRLDAVMHVYNNESQNIEFWTWFAGTCRQAREDVFLVGEVWGNEQAIMPYYETGLALFSFPFHGHDGKINKALQSGDGGRLASELARYDSEIRLRNIDGINCLFLSNHDTGRSAGFIRDSSMRKLAAAVYLLVPGNPFIYYGEEIGMTGSGDDENKRTAMYWSANDSAGMTRNPPGATNDKTPELGVAEQLDDPDSLLYYYRQILALKALFPDIYDSAVESVDTGCEGICAIRAGSVVVMHNLTGEQVDANVPAQYGELGGYLSPTGAKARIDRNVLTLPEYSSAVLTG